jgi:hypothetical protein
MFIGYSILLNYISAGYSVILDFLCVLDILSEWTICHAGHYVIGFLDLRKSEKCKHTDDRERKHWRTEKRYLFVADRTVLPGSGVRGVGIRGGEALLAMFCINNNSLV